MKLPVDPTRGRSKTVWLLGAAASAMIAAPASYAQTAGRDTRASESTDTVVVTGSRVRRPGFDTLQATSVTDSAEIEVRGYTNIANALEDTPGFGVSDSSPVSASQATLGVAQTFVDFFGLGSQRTLTLVNGRRYVSSNTAAGSGGGAAPGSQVDINLIPASLVERVETVSIGGAPVYGSDAIAGTVNFILKDNFEGLEAYAQYGVTDRGDAESWSFRATLGGNFDNGRGNAVLSAEYHEQKGLVLSDRFPFYNLVPNPANTGPSDGIPAQMVVTNTRFAVLTEGGLPYDNQLVGLAGFDLPGIVFPPIYTQGNYVRDANGTPLQFGPDGNLVPFNVGTVVQAALGAPILTDGGSGVNPADHFGLLSPTERILINGFGHYDVTPWARAFIEMSYAHTEGVEQSELYQFAAPAALGGPALTFSIDNPFLSQQARDILVANGLSTFNLNRNFNDITQRDPGSTMLDVFRVVTGLKGEFNFVGNAWNWDVAYNYGRSQSTSGLIYIDPDRLLLAIDAVTDSGGNIVCASGGSCVPINLFGVGNFSDAAVDYITDRGEARSVNEQQVITANLSSSFDIGLSQPIGFNIGYEHRDEKASFRPDATLEAGILLIGPGVNGFKGVAGGFNTDEVYGEALIPLVSEEDNLPFLRALSIEGAARYVHNSIAGGDTTWSVGGRFAPRAGEALEGLVFRGVFTRAIRAPAVTELFLGSTPTANGIADPCNAQNYNQGLNPTVRAANCAAALAAVGAPPPESFANTTGTVSAFGTLSGNPDLSNEIANSWSVGAVYQPPWLPNFRMSADWSNISLKDGIQSLGINQLLASCYDSVDFPNNPACGAFSRLTAAQAAAQPGAVRVVGDVANGYTAGFVNTSTLDFAGLIAVAQYSFGLGGGDAAVSAKMFYNHKYELVAQPGSPVVEAVGAIGTPKFRMNLTAGYNREILNRNFFANVQGVWTDNVVRDLTATTENVAAEVLFIPDYWRFNATVGAEVVNGVRAQIVVNNLFDREMPYGAQVARAFGAYDPIGRSLLFRLTASIN